MIPHTPLPQCTSCNTRDFLILDKNNEICTNCGNVRDSMSGAEGEYTDSHAALIDEKDYKVFQKCFAHFLGIYEDSMITDACIMKQRLFSCSIQKEHYCHIAIDTLKAFFVQEQDIIKYFRVKQLSTNRYFDFKETIKNEIYLIGKQHKLSRKQIYFTQQHCDAYPKEIFSTACSAAKCMLKYCNPLLKIPKHKLYHLMYKN